MINELWTIETLTLELERIERVAETYKTCTDGSYGACLHYEGYHKKKKKLKELKGE